jgi:hypothetical protein
VITFSASKALLISRDQDILSLTRRYSVNEQMREYWEDIYFKTILDSHRHVGATCR